MFQASMCRSSGEKIAVSMRHWYLSLCVDGVWSAVWIEKITPTSRRYATHTKRHIPVSHRYSDFLLMMGTWMPETCREEK